jgi:hypothetical protein
MTLNFYDMTIHLGAQRPLKPIALCEDSACVSPVKESV